MKLKQLRQEAHLTQAELAKELNVGQSTLSNWENENRTPDADTLARISEYFGVSVDYLLETSTQKQPWTHPDGEPYPDGFKNMYIETIYSLQNARTNLLRLYLNAFSDMSIDEIEKLSNTKLVTLVEKMFEEDADFKTGMFSSYKSFYESFSSTISRLICNISSMFPS